MPELLDFLIALIEFLKLLAFFIVPVIIFSFIGIQIKRVIQKKLKLDFIKSSIISSFFVLFLLLLFVYFTPWLQAFFSETIGLRPAFAQPTLFEAVYFFVVSITKLLVISIILSVLLLPFILGGAFLMDYFKDKIRNYYVNFLVSVALITSVFLILWLYLFPWASIALFYLIYFV